MDDTNINEMGEYCIVCRCVPNGINHLFISDNVFLVFNDVDPVFQLRHD